MQYNSLTKKKYGLFKRQSMLFIMCWKGSPSRDGGCLLRDGSSSLNSVSPLLRPVTMRESARDGVWVGWRVFPAGCQVLPGDKSNLPHKQPAPSAGSKSHRSSREAKKQSEKTRNSHARSGRLAGEGDGPEVGSARPGATFSGASVSAEQMAPGNLHAVDFFSGAPGRCHLMERVGSGEISSPLGAWTEIGVC